MALDFKKTQKELYNPKTTPSIVDVPQMTFIKVDGQGDPNTSAEYSSAVELLYSLSYNIKMNNKKILDYVVLPLEGFWDWDESKDKTKFKWTALIR
ncbi:MAG: transcriptional regulator, partial [Clostridiaceae bacterium]|nr:transcriptional regulator [Clostridiaceae bacterium]